VQDLKVQFFVSGGTVNAVDGVSFEIDRGEIVGIVGESGSGKTMTALSLLRLIPEPGRITNGRILYGEKDVAQMTDEEIREFRGNEIAMIFQDPMTSLNPVLRIGFQVEEAMIAHQRFSNKQAKERVVPMLQRVRIPAAKDRVRDYPHQFSGGMRQRAMIAMALACEPKLLIADEPTTALDVTIQAQILDLLRELVAEENAALILITHDLGVVAGMCERVNVMYAGMFMETAGADQLFAAPRHPYTLGLLQSVPRLDAARRARLHPIEGAPPNMLNAPAACPFQPRCRYEVAQSRLEVPPLRQIEPGHMVACFNPVAAEEWERTRAAATA